MQRKIKIVSLVLITIAGIVRLLGVKFGFELINVLNYPPHPDEPTILFRARDMVLLHDFNPHFFNYPTLYIYIQAVAQYFYFIVYDVFVVNCHFVDIPISHLYVAGRVVTVLFSVGTIYLVYRMAIRLFDKYSTLFAIFFLSFSILHIQNAFLVKVDTAMAFWVLLSFLVSVKIFYGNAELKWYLLNAIIIGLAIGTKYTAVFALIPFILAHLNASLKHRESVFNNNIAIAILLIPIIFIITTPYAILDVNTFISHIKYESAHYRYGHLGSDSEYLSYGYYLVSLYQGLGLLGSVILLIGLVALYRHDRNLFILLISFPLTYFLFLGGYKTRVDRHMTVVIPYLALFAGFGCAKMLEFVITQYKRKKLHGYVAGIIVGLFALLTIGWQLMTIGNYMWNINLTDTRVLAFYWIDENLNKQSKILEEHATPPLDTKIFVNAKHVPYLGTSTEVFSNYDYLVTSSYSYNAFINNSEKYPQVSNRYKDIFENYILMKRISPQDGECSGPTISIYKTSKR